MTLYKLVMSPENHSCFPAAACRRLPRSTDLWSVSARANSDACPTASGTDEVWCRIVTGSHDYDDGMYPQMTNGAQCV
jgi:hypothetical protein